MFFIHVILNDDTIYPVILSGVKQNEESKKALEVSNAFYIVFVLLDVSLPLNMTEIFLYIFLSF